MASFTAVEAPQGVVSRSYQQRRLAHVQAVAPTGTVDRQHARRLWSLDQGDATSDVLDADHDRRLFGFGEGDARHADLDAGHERRLFEFGGDEAGRRYLSGIPIPSSAFRLVEVEVLDQNGDPLADAVWVQSAGVFPTSAPVNGQGIAHLWLLDGIEYRNFLCLGTNVGRGKFDYVWYEAVGSNDVDPFTKETTLVFDKSTAKPVGGGLNMAGGLGMG